MTDSVQVERSKDEKNPGLGEGKNLKPYAYKRSEHYIRKEMCDGVPFA